MRFNPKSSLLLLLNFALLFLFLLCASISEATAQTGATFGPHTFTLNQNRSGTTIYFSIRSLPVLHTLTIVNGNPDKTQRVKKGQVILNGLEVIGIAQFNKRCHRLTVALPLGEENELAISFKGNAGSFITVILEPTSYPIPNHAFTHQLVRSFGRVTVTESPHHASAMTPLAAQRELSDAASPPSQRKP